MNSIITIIIAIILIVPAAHAKEKAWKGEVCHNGKTLSVSMEAYNGHLIHGDSIGKCDDIEVEDDVVSNNPDEPVIYTCTCPPGISECSCADGSSGTPSGAPVTAAGPNQFRSIYGH